MRKAVLLCTLVLAACSEPRSYSYPSPYDAPMAPPPQRPAPVPSYTSPTPPPKSVKPLGAGALTAKNVGGYIDQEERELRKDLHGSGVGVTRPGDSITLVLRSDILFLSGPTKLSPRGMQILSTIAAVTARYDSTALIVNGYTDTADPPDRALQVTQERAVRVCQILISAGIDPRRIDEHGMGAAHPKIPTGPNFREPRNRRIEIVISPKMAG